MATVKELLAIIEMERYNLDDPVTLEDVLRLLNRPDKVDIEHTLFIRFYTNIVNSFKAHPAQLMIVKAQLQSLADYMVKVMLKTPVN